MAGNKTCNLLCKFGPFLKCIWWIWKEVPRLAKIYQVCGLHLPNNGYSFLWALFPIGNKILASSVIILIKADL